jgi:hypothetical protein
LIFDSIIMIFGHIMSSVITVAPGSILIGLGILSRHLAAITGVR